MSSAKIKANVIAVVLLACFVLAAISAPSALAREPRWQLSVTSMPTNLRVGGEGVISVLAWNVGGAAPQGDTAPLRISANLPAGVTATKIREVTQLGGPPISYDIQCAPVPEVSCTWSAATSPYGEVLTEYGSFELQISVTVTGEPRSAPAEARIEGAETQPKTVDQQLNITGSAAGFGFTHYEFAPENRDGSLDTQAGSHPFELNTTFVLNSDYEHGSVAPTAMARNVRVNLPPGLVGNPGAAPQCSEQDFTTLTQFRDLCPANTAVGVALVTIREPADKLNNGYEPYTKVEPVFNLPPEPGEPARFGFIGVVIPITLDTAVRSSGDYGVVVSSNNIVQTTELLATRIIIWGNPGDPGHTASRGWDCLYSGPNGYGYGKPCIGAGEAPAFLTLPTSCEGPLQSSVEAESWATPSEPAQTAKPLSYTTQDETGAPVGLSGCGRVPFTPSASIQPETQAGNSPTGMNVDLKVPQDTILSEGGLGPADVKDTVVTLPEGVEVNPASANGLEGCSEGQIGFTGTDPEGKNLFSSSLSENPCPNASKIGVVRIKTPLLANELVGGVYLAAQTSNPFGSLFAMYIVVRDPVSGVALTLAGEVAVDEHSGRLVSSFRDTPQLPFEELKLELFGGPGAPLSTPSACGVYAANVSFDTWSGVKGVQAASAPFTIATGPGGVPCAKPRPFAPTLAAGSVNNQGGAYAPFAATFSREDSNQNLAGVTLHLPPGLVGRIAAVTPCGEPQASLGTCGSASEIGHVHATVGLGPTPYSAPEGRVFITQSYKGAPYGLSIATPAKAGPFDLGTGGCDCVVVRAKVEVDPRTSDLTVVSDPLPLRLRGIPLQIKHVTVTTDRPGFTFNPTDCNPLSIDASFTGEEGSSSSTSVPYQAADCASLKFAPRFTASTSAHTSRADGASLKVKLTYPAGAMGTQANVKSVKVDLPKHLPSRLETLKKACTAATFATNPASCPPESIVGHAVVHTQVLPVPLEGPAYFVSHGGEGFPNLILVLQGDGITIQLVGDTFISNSQITSSTFRTTPDVPFESFELTLPQGKYSALAGVGNLCRQKLVMPTAFVAQNGATLKQDTHIEVQGCAHALTSIRTRVAGRTLKLSVHVPAAGRLSAAGAGVGSAATSSNGSETISLTLHARKSGAFATTIKLNYVPSKGKHLAKTMKVQFRN
jgi:hypothetical protein